MKIVRVHYTFDLENDDSNGPAGPDYFCIDLVPRKSDVSDIPSLRDAYISIYLNESISFKKAEELRSMLTDNVMNIQFYVYDPGEGQETVAPPRRRKPA